MRYVFVLIFIIYFGFVTAQDKLWHVALTSNATSFPITGYPVLFYANLHPGIDAAYMKQINHSDKNRLLLQVQSTFYYHRFVQSLITCSPSLIYEYKLGKLNFLNIGLGAGGGLAFEHEATFKLNSTGDYEQRSMLHPRGQYLVQFQFGYNRILIKDKLSSPKIAIGFRTTMQGTFVKSYVPLLPVNSCYIGLQFPINRKVAQNQ
ncbi:MAG: hypothetical protein ACK53R_08610 [Bacteroidota bacterium]|jgi:hypothetical protein